MSAAALRTVAGVAMIPAPVERKAAEKQREIEAKEQGKKEAEIKPEKISTNELLQRIEESKKELPETMKKELEKDYDEVTRLIKEEDLGAQEKIQKLLKKLKETKTEEATEKEETNKLEAATGHLQFVAGKLTLTSTKASDVEVTDSLRFSEWLNAGQKFGTCQSWSSSGGYNRALVSFIADASKKMIGVYDKGTGELIARGVMYLTEKEGEWGLYLDDVYYATEKQGGIIKDFVNKKAREMNVKVFERPGEFIGKAPYTYANNAGGLVKQKEIVVENNFIK